MLRVRGWKLGWPYELMTENIVCDVRETGSCIPSTNLGHIC